MRPQQLLIRARRASRRIPRPVLRGTVGLGTAAVVVVAALDMESSMPSLHEIQHPGAVWLLLAILLELGALVAYALIVRAVLAVWRVNGRTRALLRATLGGIAMGASLPAGQAVSLTYWYRQLRREGAEPRLAAFALVAAGAAGVISLTVLLVLGVVLAGDTGPLANVRIPVLVAGAAVITLRVLLRRPLGRLARKALSHWSLDVPSRSALGPRRLATIGVYAYLNWLLDLGCLMASLAAMRANVPVQSVLLTYALAQIVANLPLLPGGGGTVEISLIVGFAAFGQKSGSVVGGVLLFRLVSCWGLVPIGWLAVALDRHRLRRAGRRESGQLAKTVQFDRPHPLARHTQLGRDAIDGSRQAVAEPVA